MTAFEIIKENKRRVDLINDTFNPLTGEGSPLERVPLRLSDYILPVQYIPISMANKKLVTELSKSGSILSFLKSINVPDDEIEQERENLIKQFVLLRIKHDFPFWAYSYVKIKNKFGGKNIPFKLNRPQRKLLLVLERMRLADLPIRVILLKARQWGGATLVQIYMAWIQLVHKEGFYSAIVAQDTGTSRKIRAMYSKMLKEYPPELLDLDPSRKLELTPYEGSHNDTIISQKGEVARDSVICIGTAERPDSIRGGDISLAHMSEVGLWKATDGKTPEDIIRSVSSSILLEPLTIDIIESTANGTGNFFHTEWLAAKDKKSDRTPVFVSWFEIDMYSKPFKSDYEKENFINFLIDNRENTEETSRSESGRYLWKLWKMGATLEAINWYVSKRKSYNSHSDMAAEFPSDDIEAFKHSGKKVFDQYAVEELRKYCRDPRFKGEVRGEATEGKKSLSSTRFVHDSQGLFKVWELPDKEIIVSNRYLVVVDVGGRSDKADFSIITVLDRFWLMYGDKPVIVAEWSGHIRHDLLAWKMAQIAEFYNRALLVVESNTYEKDQDTDGDHTEYILNQIGEVYPNMYKREASEQSIKEGRPTMWGFQTNRLTKPLIIDNLVKYIEEQLYIERDKETIDEYLCYEKKKNGAFGAIDGKHDDKLMTRAIALHISNNMPLPKIIENKPKVAKRKVISAATL